MSVITFAAFLFMLAAVLAILTDWLFKTLDPWAADVQPQKLPVRIAQRVVSTSGRVQRTVRQTATKRAISYQNEIRELPFLC